MHLRLFVWRNPRLGCCWAAYVHVWGIKKVFGLTIRVTSRKSKGADKCWCLGTQDHCMFWIWCLKVLDSWKQISDRYIIRIQMTGLDDIKSSIFRFSASLHVPFLWIEYTKKEKFNRHRNPYRGVSHIFVFRLEMDHISNSGKVTILTTLIGMQKWHDRTPQSLNWQ